MTDIVPEILEKIQKDFAESIKGNPAIDRVYNLIQSGTATYADVNNYAVWMGRSLAGSIRKFVTADVLPDGRMYYNIADRILGATLKDNYEMVSTVAEEVQATLNRNVGIGIKAIKPKLNTDRIKGLVDKVSNEIDFTNVAWLLDEPIVNFSQSVADDALQANVDFHGKAGLQAKVIRTPESGACQWCRDVAGEYSYPDVPEDVWRRHERCHCIIDYTPSGGKTERLSGTGKSW